MAHDVDPQERSLAALKTANDAPRMENAMLHGQVGVLQSRVARIRSAPNSSAGLGPVIVSLTAGRGGTVSPLGERTARGARRADDAGPSRRGAASEATPRKISLGRRCGEGCHGLSPDRRSL
jgi:hypothetical protein